MESWIFYATINFVIIAVREKSKGRNCKNLQKKIPKMEHPASFILTMKILNLKNLNLKNLTNFENSILMIRKCGELIDCMVEIIGL